MRYVLGFDGGGTKTECVLMDEAQHILARSRSGPSNPYRVGCKAAFASLHDAAQIAIAEARIDRHSVAALCAGLAGASHAELSEQMRALLSNAFPNAAVKVCTDLDLILAAAGDGPAVVLVAGTGSSAMARNSDGQFFRAGGYGPQIGDEGSAYDVGRRAVLASLRERDRTGDDYPLGRKILAHLGNRTWPEIQQSISAAPDEVFPRVFPIVALAAEDHDELARVLLRDAARELAALVRVVAMRAGLQGKPFVVAKTGGMLGRSLFFDAQLGRELHEAEPKARISVFGDLAETAARLALRHLSQAGAAGH